MPGHSHQDSCYDKHGLKVAFGFGLLFYLIIKVQVSLLLGFALLFDLFIGARTAQPNLPVVHLF